MNDEKRINYLAPGKNVMTINHAEICFALGMICLTEYKTFNVVSIKL